MVYTFSNLDVTNITNINNFKFNDNTNIVYLNNTINTDSNNTYYLSFDNSNSTFIIDNVNNPIYKKKISQVSKYPKQLFTSNNHNLKINDLITLQNIKKNNINILNDSLLTNYTIYKVIETTRNTFKIKSFNNFNNSINNISYTSLFVYFLWSHFLLFCNSKNKKNFKFIFSFFVSIWSHGIY